MLMVTCLPSLLSVRQGCPLSPLLYILVAEVLAVNIFSNPRITGLSIPSLSPISQYDDYTSIIVSSIPFVPRSRLFSLFEWGPGAKLKQCNSKRFWRGRWDPLLPWIGPLKVLSVFASPGDLESANWRPRQDEV